MSIPNEVYEFLESLNPEDSGEKVINGFRVKFEGFTDACWDAVECNSIEDLEHSILTRWGVTPDYGWIRDITFGKPGVFYAIYKQ